jgi:hypothetical protein
MRDKCIPFSAGIAESLSEPEEGLLEMKRERIHEDKKTTLHQKNLHAPSGTQRLRNPRTG